MALLLELLNVVGQVGDEGLPRGKVGSLLLTQKDNLLVGGSYSNSGRGLVAYLIASND